MASLRDHPVVFLLRETLREWSEDNCLRLGAALAYYTLFSIAPLLVLVIAIAALFFGERVARGELLGQLEDVIGAQGAVMVRGMIERAARPASGLLATASSLVVTALGASSVFGQLQQALNEIWNVPKRTGRGLARVLIDRLSSFSMILVIGFLLLVSLLLSAAIGMLNRFVGDLFPGSGLVMEGANFAVSFGVITLLFAMIYKILPDARIRWGDVWVGAAFTALLFTVGKLGIAFYLSRSAAGSVYGAAGSLVVLLLWVYYSSQLLFLGAEFTQVWARTYGSWRRDDDPLARRSQA